MTNFGGCNPGVLRKAALLAYLVFAIGHGWSYGPSDDTAFEHKSPFRGVPFAWPSTWSEASSSAIKRTDVLRFLADLDSDVGAIQSFRFVPLERDKFYLVADVDASGNGLFGNLEIVHCEGRACAIAGLLTEAEDLETDLVDADRNGVFQVITKEAAGFRTLSTHAMPPFVYSIRSLMGGKLVDTSIRYSDYFENHILPRMEADRKEIEAEIAKLDRPQPLYITDLDGKHRSPAEEENDRRATLENERFKQIASVELLYVQDDYRRRILRERTAGLENALKWARSDDEGLREFGVKALEPIDSSLAAAELLRLADSGEPGGPGHSSAANDARNALMRRAQARLAPPPMGTNVK